MKKIRTKFLPLLLALVTILSLLPTSAFAASKTGSGIQITQNQAYWSTRLLANGTPYSYRPPLADGKLVYCMDSGLGYHYATKSFLDSFTWTSGSGADADAVLQSAITNSGLSEMDAMTIENVKWMMTYLNDCKASNVGQLFMAVQTYVWENQSYKGEPGGDGDAGGYANADTYELYLSLIDDLLAKKAAEDAEFLKQIEAYKAQGIEASIVEDASAKWAVFAISSNRKNQSFFNYYGPRKLSVGEAKPDQPEQPTGGTGKITLKKTAAGTLKGLPGARYSIYFNGQIVGSDVTGESGELHIEDAATGLWTFVETAAPSGYCLDPTPKSVYVDVSEGDREYTVAAVNYAMPSMIIYKEDAQTSAPVPGTVLSVKSVTGAYSTSVKIGESGSATLEGLEPGVYVVSEESVPEPYILSNTEQTVALRPGKTTEVHFQDYKKPGLEILKKNIANMDPIPDMTYKVEQIDGSFETTVTTDLRGRAFLADLPVGSYRISEVGGPSNVILSEIPQVIYLEAGCTRTVTFFNAIKPTLTVLKQNSVTSDPLPGAKLHIYYASDNTSTGEMHDLGVFYSNEEGKVILTDAERGWYKIVEESCPQGFGFLDGEAVQEFYLEENTSKTVIIRNVPLSALVGFKYDTKTGKGIPGCRFELRYLSGNTSGTGGTVIGTYVTGPNGAFTVTGLKKGTYICEEVSSDGNHIIDSEPQTVWISGEDQDVVIIRFGNSPFGSLLITKLSDDNKRSPIPNTDFLLTYSDGTFVGNDNGIYTTNAAGEILVDGLEPGVTIIVREVRAAAGFLLDESPQHIQIKSGETVHLQFLNKPLGNLIIKKNSSAPTQEAVPGAEFEITYADGSYVDAAGGTISSNGRYVTDEHGEIRISGIVGTVVVTEIKSGPGYQLDEANRTQTVTINPGDTQTLQFYNTPISKVEFIKVDENDRSVRIPDTTIEVRRLDGALVTTLVTSESGQAFAQLEDGSYYAVETVANPKYQLDSITGYGYATTVGSCWLAPLVEAGEGVNMSFLVKRQSKEKILSKIAQTTMVNRSRMRDVGDTRQDYEELDSAINSGLYLKDVMNRQGEDFYYMHTLIEVTAPDPETLEQRATEVEKLCVSVDMIARRCDYKNEQAFLSSLPILALDPDIERKARRNALTSGVAAAFPFASYELSDHNGIFLGLNLYNRSPVFLDPYDDYKYTNGNWWIGGSTGAGKTVTLQCLGGRLRQQGKRVIIIAPKKGHEFRPLCEKLGGLYLRMSPSSKDCPNLMAIRRKSLDSYAKLKNIAARDDSVLADKISQLIIWFALKKKDLSEEDKSRLDSSLVEVYGRYGITFDNSSIVDENGDFRTMPIISDWYDVLSQNPDTRYLSVVLSRYVTGSAAAMASRNSIDLDNKYIVLDLSGMPDDMIADGTFWATSIAYDLIMSCESDLSALLADELWSLVGATANPQAAGFVLEMVKTIRGLGGIAVTSTQGMQDLFGLDGGSYGKGILDASRIKLVMQMEEQEARLIQDKLNLSEDEVRQITRFRRGEGLLCIGYNHVPVAFHTTPKEYEAITTSPTDLRRGRSEYGDE